jgi:hypothetical protein
MSPESCLSGVGPLAGTEGEGHDSNSSEATIGDGCDTPGPEDRYTCRADPLARPIWWPSRAAPPAGAEGADAGLLKMAAGR